MWRTVPGVGSGVASGSKFSGCKFPVVRSPPGDENPTLSCMFSDLRGWVSALACAGSSMGVWGQAWRVDGASVLYADQVWRINGAQVHPSEPKHEELAQVQSHVVAAKP